MTKREAKRVAKVLASVTLDHLIDTGGLWDDQDIPDVDLDRIEQACHRLADDLYWQGAKEGGPVVSVADAIKVALPDWKGGSCDDGTDR